ncbi:hypothetical protein Cantr_07380 [Candida viswanathii]|uniref:Uncharacterized protein n=1 Tax=Candida viswanathii TaxID=5486 RepID=A0A367Y1Y7_9ASCO|nr:hypothetical protein Cantr_07380 [Candida viswanathii]
MPAVDSPRRNSLLLSLKRSNGSYSSNNSASTTNSVSSACLSIKQKYSTRLAVVKRKCSTIKLKLKKGSSSSSTTRAKTRELDIRDYDSDEITIVARYSNDKFHNVVHQVHEVPSEKIPLDELTDATLKAVCYQLTNQDEKPFYFEWSAEVEELELLPVTTTELPLPPPEDDSLVESWEKYCEAYEPSQPEIEPQTAASSPPPPPPQPASPPRYQPRSIPPTIKYKSQLNEYLKEASEPYASLSSYYLNLHNSFANYHLIVRDGSYQCRNYESLQPIIEESNKTTKVCKTYLYYILLIYISFALLRSLF